MPKNKRKRGGFEIVPAGFIAQHSLSSSAKKLSGPNTLRNAHIASLGGSKAATAAARKANEIWFRKCGHGETLFTSYYKGQGNIIPLKEWPDFTRVMLESALPVTFRLHGSSDGRRELERRLEALGAAAPVPWAPTSEGIWQAAAGIDKRSLSKGGKGVGADVGGGSGMSSGLGGIGGGGSGHVGSARADAARLSTGLSELLAEGTGSGLLNRQEAVSMLPVLALQVAPGNTCLDVCASPGSKTMQLLEAVSAGGGRAGLVVANDAHPKRVATLLDSLERHGRSDAERSRLVVTCHRGEALPRPARPFRKQPADDDAAGTATASSEDADGAVGFDRVLTDVPCSGDGTIRKDRTVLPRWTPAVSNQLHGVQLEIGWRALELLRVGGRMVYSTCSLNPIEDEAVVAALLQRANGRRQGAVTLQKWPADVLPKLRRRAGVFSWRVAEHIEVAASNAPLGGGGGGAGGGGSGGGGGGGGVQKGGGGGGKKQKRRKGGQGVDAASRLLAYNSDDEEEEPEKVGAVGGGTAAPDADDDDADAEVRLRWHARYEDAEAADMPHAVPTMWPPSREEAAAMHLERCSRLLPHDQDTGGFFVAILVKHAPLDAPAREREVTGSGGEEEGGEADGCSSRLEPPPQPSLPPSGPASCRELPELEPEQTMAPLPAREADEIGGRLGLKRGAARRRLLRRPNGPVHLAPAALSAFAPGTVSVAWAGLPADR